MNSLLECLREVGLESYTDRFSEEGCKMVADAVDMALDSVPAVTSPEIPHALSQIDPHKYGSIGHHKLNKYLHNPNNFLVRRLREVVDSILGENAHEGKYKLIIRCLKSKMVYPRIFYRDEKAMRDLVKSRLSRRIVYEFT